MLLIGLPLIGFLMVSRVRYSHAASTLFKKSGRFSTLVYVVFVALGLYVAPVPLLFFVGLTYTGYGLLGAVREALRSRRVSLIED